VKIHQIRAFLALYEIKHFGKAAQSLHIATPTLSETISSLEHQLGHQLFTRKPVRPTSAAELLLPLAKKVVGAHDEIIDLREELRSERCSPIRVGTFHRLGAELVRQAADLISTDSHRIVPKIKVYGWHDSTCGLSTNQTDIAILVGPTSYDHKLQRTTIYEDSRIAVLPKRFRTKNQSIMLNELDEFGWVDANKGIDPRWRDSWRLDDHRGAPPKVTASGHDNIFELAEAVIAGDGAFAASATFRGTYRDQDFTLLPILDAPAIKVDVAWKNSKIDHITKHLVRATLELSSLPPKSIYPNYISKYMNR